MPTSLTFLGAVTSHVHSSPRVRIFSFLFRPVITQIATSILIRLAGENHIRKACSCFPHKLQVFNKFIHTDKMDFSPQMFRNIPKVAYDHYKEGNLNYPMIIYVSLVHIVAVAGLFALPKCSKETLFWAFILWPIR